MKKEYKKQTSLVVVACIAVISVVTFLSCSRDDDNVHSSLSNQSVCELSEAERVAVNNFYKEITGLHTSLPEAMSKASRRADAALSTEDENNIKEKVTNLDNNSIELLEAFGLESNEIEELQLAQSPLVATLVANGLVEYLETLEAVEPETPVIDISNGVWVSTKDYRQMSLACLADIFGIDPVSIVGIISLGLTTQQGITSAIIQIIKAAKGNLAKYLAAGYTGVCILYIQWGLCMKEKLDNLH